MRARYVRFDIGLRPPYDAEWMLAFLGRRALPGVERVDGGVYERITPAGAVRVRPAQDAVTVTAPRGLDRAEIEHRVRRLFDLDADSSTIDAHLARDPVLAERMGRRAGLRVPGAWDGYELAVRAVLGQQVSVERATRLAHALIDAYGESRADGSKGFPAPKALAAENPSHIGMPRQRGAAISELAAAAVAGGLDAAATPERLRTLLLEIPGIGPWTAEYVAMRSGRDADAFPSSDWVVLKELGTTAAGARRRAESWRPYRAYAVMYLWAAAARRREAT